MKLILPALTLGFVRALIAQDLTVPPALANVEAPSSGELPGFPASLKQQFLVSASLLQGLAGKTIDEVWFRRDGHRAGAFSQGSATLRVQVSSNAVDPAVPSRTFAANHGPVPTLVFAGQVIAPASTSVGTDRWALDQTIRIAFNPPLAYGGGNLCIDIEGAAVVGSKTRWFLDNAYLDVDGSLTSYGVTCVGWAPPDYEVLRGEPETFAVGSRGFLYAQGQIGAPGALILGGLGVAGGLDLTTSGMTGCRLYVNPLVLLSMPVTQTIPVIGATAPGLAPIELPIPTFTAMLGATLHAQYLGVEIRSPYSNPLQVTTSRGMQIRIASMAMSLGASMVSSGVITSPTPMPTTGWVSLNCAPVIRFRYH